MRDYLNNRERSLIVAMLKMADNMEEFLNGSLFNKDEKSDIKRSITYMCKAIVGKVEDGKPIIDKKHGVLNRLNQSAIKAFDRSVKNSRVFISDKSEIETYIKRRKADLNAAYEENRDYFKLVELIISDNCKGCKKCGTNCPFYHEFEEKCIPEFDGVKKFDNCKYAYELD